MPPKGKGKANMPAAPTWDKTLVMRPVKKLRSEMGRSAPEKKTLEDIGMAIRKVDSSKNVSDVHTKAVSAAVAAILYPRLGRSVARAAN